MEKLLQLPPQPDTNLSMELSETTQELDAFLEDGWLGNYFSTNPQQGNGV
ncbi:MAG: hypothetical protein M3Z14_04610 [Candidatus Eremiobacteraeota bacterium]|nr:hypothetical protein [Candidatus Eremiobacteraeota bacterium]